MTRTLRLLGLALFLFAALPVQAQSVKIGYTDPDLLIQNMPEFQQIRQQIQTEVQLNQEALESLQLDFQDAVAKYQKQQPLLSEERRAQREQELVQMQSELQQAATQKEQEIAQHEADLLNPLLQKVQDAIDEVATSKGLDLVLRSPGILYINEDAIVDITLDVARKLGLPIDEEAAAASSTGGSN